MRHRRLLIALVVLLIGTAVELSWVGLGWVGTWGNVRLHASVWLLVASRNPIPQPYRYIPIPYPWLTSSFMSQTLNPTLSRNPIPHTYPAHLSLYPYTLSLAHLIIHELDPHARAVLVASVPQLFEDRLLHVPHCLHPGELRRGERCGVW